MYKIWLFIYFVNARVLSMLTYFPEEVKERIYLMTPWPLLSGTKAEPRILLVYICRVLAWKKALEKIHLILGRVRLGPLFSMQFIFCLIFRDFPFPCRTWCQQCSHYSSLIHLVHQHKWPDSQTPYVLLRWFALWPYQPTYQLPFM